MRSLYWKIFVSFWLATILIIVTTAWITSQITRKSSLPAREQAFMDSYANAAVVTYESGQGTSLMKWLKQIGLSHHMSIYLLTSTGEIIGANSPPPIVVKVARHLIRDQLSEGIFKSGKLIVSHEIISTSGKFYRLAAISDKPIAHFIEIPWTGLAIRLILAIFISGLVCYLLSLYLTQPLRSLRMAAKSIATGNLQTRVGHFRGHNKDEIAALSNEFDRMAEQLQSMVQDKERLLQDISHELRSPIARINIAIELAKNKAGDLAKLELDRMETETSRLNALIGEIMTFARLDQSTTELNTSLTDLPELIDEIIKDANYEFASKGITLVKGKTEPCQLTVDTRLLRRAIENIVRNALQYSESGQQVILSVYQKLAKNEVWIDIQDNGPGVPKNQLRNIFNPFYRVDSSRTKKTGGYGLGLSIAARAIILHQGKISARNSPEGGLLVRIRLPLNKKSN
jgi:two-component system sensor histidine kinase CpxA